MVETVDIAELDGIEEIENLWIPMRDGCRLAARMWRPRSALAAPVPALLEYLPYRKRDLMRERDEPMHRYYALNGYASLRVDLRGTGDSQGVLHDEYSAAEHDDALEVIAWIAKQPWCTGRIGMMGISWGGFNALQVAALAPPGLEAIITLCASDDRFADDAHYKGGCILNENMAWGTFLTMNNALPPDPEIAGEDWRGMWRERIEALEPFPALWMRHPARDDYWQHGSVCEDYAAIRCPVYVIGGWADGYTNAVPRLLANLTAPRKGLIGPWPHSFPQDGVPGPAIGFLQEAVRWWDHWLKDVDTGIMDEPVMRAWMQASATPQPLFAERPGRWIAEEAWPSPRIAPLTLRLDAGRLSPAAEAARGEGFELTVCSPQTVGLRGGEWCGFGADGEAPGDQRPDDGGSLVFDSDPLKAPIELFGAPVVELAVRSDRPSAMMVVRLCDVDPSGVSSRISFGVLNLAHREGPGRPVPLEPGQWYDVRLQLDDLAAAVPAGHRLRLAVSTAYWPMLWPSPQKVTLGVRAGAGRLTLPVRPLRAEDADLTAFQPPRVAPGTPNRKLRRMHQRRNIEVNLVTNEVIHSLIGDGGELGGASLTHIEEIDLDLGMAVTRRQRIVEDDPLSAQTEMAISVTMRRGDWAIRVECRNHLTATADLFQFSGDVQAFEGDAPFAKRHWALTIPRQLV
jgi:hypothetical protein